MATLAVEGQRPHVAASTTRASIGARRVQGFVLFQFLCGLALLVPQIGAFRLFVRMAALGASFVLLLVTRNQHRAHPATGAGRAVLAIVGLAIFHPLTDSIEAAAAQLVLYAAVIGPLFWAAQVTLEEKDFRRILLVFWVFNAASATVGVLQFYFPGRFEPPVSTVILAQGDAYLRGLYIVGRGGARILRPMGLTDVPGGAGTGAFYTVVLGMGFLLTSASRATRNVALLAIFVGAACLVVSQVRAMMVMAAVCVGVLAFMLVLRMRVKKLAMVAPLMTVATIATISWAVTIAGPTITSRASDLISTNPQDVYYRNRGHFLSTAIDELLPTYPFGAGLGRWGMAESYFRASSNRGEPALSAEIQWTGWLYDGGILLVIAYATALLMALRTAFRISKQTRWSSSSLSLWGAVFVAYNVGSLALTFSYPMFIGDMGLQFWLLNAVLFAAARTAWLQHAKSATGGAAVPLPAP